LLRVLVLASAAVPDIRRDVARRILARRQQDEENKKGVSKRLK